MKLKDVKPKYLVLGEVFDDFSRATEGIDYSKEDLCGYINGLTNVFYWINTESVWGPIGFNWENYNIETRKGNGKFSSSNLDFSIIPKIPDSYRHTSLENIFDTINRDLLFLDSNWSHIGTIKNLSTKNTVITCNYESLKDTNTTIDNTTNTNISTRYILHGNLNSVKSKALKLTLIPENKNKLHLIYYTDGGINITLKDINDTIFNFDNYITFDTYSTYGNSTATTVNTINSLANLKTLHCKTVAMTRGDIVCVYPTINNNKNNPIDEIIIDLTKIVGCTPNNTYRLNTYRGTGYTKKITYKGLDFNKFSDILGNPNKLSRFYNRVIFNKIPNITNIPIDKVDYLFYDCIFKDGYDYGRIYSTSNMFYGCILDVDKTIGLYKITDDGIVSSARAADYTDILDIYISDYDHSSYPTCIGADFYIFNTDNLIVNSSNKSVISSKTNSITYTDRYYGYPILVNNFENSVIIENTVNCYNIDKEGYYIGFYFTSDDIHANYIKFNVTEENITESDSTFETLTYFHKFYNNTNEKIKVIIRRASYTFTEKDNILKEEDVNIVIYRPISLDFKAKDLDIEMIEKVLSSIITVDDVEDAKDCTITIKSTYLQNINSETIDRLLADGYTIVENI